METCCWPLPGMTGISKEYRVLQIGTERVNLLNPLNLWLVMFSCHFKRLMWRADVKNLYNFKMSQLNVSWFPIKCAVVKFANHSWIIRLWLGWSSSSFERLALKMTYILWKTLTLCVCVWYWGLNSGCTPWATLPALFLWWFFSR
jgi:hypothetical protein